MRKYLLVLVALCAALLLPRGAEAHANLLESDPVANSVVEAPPPTARLRFSEPLEPEYSRAVLASADSGPIGTSPSRVAPDDPYTMLLDLPELPDGQYVLQWRALSQADGHTSQGVVAFAVGDPASAEAPLVLPPPPPNPLALPPLENVLLRWLTFGALALILGTLIMRWWVWRAVDIPGASDDAFERRTHRLLLVAAVVALCASFGTLWSGASASESDIVSFAAGSRVGTILALRAVLCAGVLLAILIPSAYAGLTTALIALGAIATISLLSHSAVPQGGGASGTLATVSAVAFDYVHLLATAAWIGSLPALLLGLLALNRETPETRRRVLPVLVARYTGLATAAIMVLVSTGLFAALRQIGSLSELWSTTYGRALSLKLGIFAVLLALGALNRWRIAPLLERRASSETANRRLQRSVIAEIALSAALLLAVGALTATPPGRDVAGRSGDFAETITQDGRSLTLQVARGNIAGDTFVVNTFGLPEGFEPEAVLRASMASHDMGVLELQLEPVEPGRWAARAPMLNMPGEWNVETIVRAPGMNDLRHTFIVPTLLNTATQPQSPTALWAVLLIVALVLAGLSQMSDGRRWQWRLQTGSLVLVFGAFVAAVVPYYVARATEPSNPFEPTAEVLAAGKTVYQEICVPCHGVSGTGDGPAARTLPGLPGDFTAPHFATHNEGELYSWIRGGKPEYGDAGVWREA